MQKKFLLFPAMILLASMVPELTGQEKKTKPAPVRFLEPIAAAMEPDEVIVYKKAGDRELEMHLFHPPGFRQKNDEKRSVFLIIHGGGWTGGEPRKFYPVAKHFAAKGMLGISLQYRLMNPKLGTTVFDCVKDGRSAVRYLRANAERLGIDPELIAVSGGSAGGHVAVGTALFDQINESTDELETSPVPNALILLNPVIDTSEAGYGNSKIGERWNVLSPLHQVRGGIPPTIIFHSTEDRVTPYSGAKAFAEASTNAGNECILKTHEGGRHGYFIFDETLYDQVVSQTEAFLSEQGFLANQ